MPRQLDVSGTTGTEDVNIVSVSGAAITLGQKPMATSFPIVIASDQTAIPVSQSGSWDIANITTSVTPGTAASHLGKARDGLIGAADTGVPVYGFRNDNNLATTTQDLAYTPLSTDSTGAFKLVGTVSHDSADSGNPIKIGGRGHTTRPTAVGNNDRVNAYLDEHGRIGVNIDAVNGEDLDQTNPVPVEISPDRSKVNHQQTAITSTTETTILAAAGASLHNDLTNLVITNEEYEDNQITIRESNSGTTVMILDLAPKGGISIPFQVPLPQATANATWTAELSKNPTGDVNFFVMAVERDS